ncbi:MAG: hypothetical protein AAFZ80_09235 [Cyanobacteria bacterium P01_A01_bin.105]
MYQPLAWNDTLSELVMRVMSSSEVTARDRVQLKALLLEDDLPDEARLAIDRILQGIRRGRLELISD